MSDDLLRLIVVVAVAFLAYHVLKDGDLIKNTGTLNAEAEPYEDEEEAIVSRPAEEEYGAEEAQAETQEEAPKTVVHSQVQDEIYKNNPNVLGHPQMSNNHAPQGNYSSSNNFAQLDCFPKDQAKPQDLLPTEGGFSESNPAPQGHLMNRNLFESSHHAGLNTQSNSLRNGNRQIRSDPLIPRVDVGPWHQSTYEADTNRRTFEIGGM